MKILDPLPITNEPATISLGAETVTIRRCQIFVWVGL